MREYTEFEGEDGEAGKDLKEELDKTPNKCVICGNPLTNPQKKKYCSATCLGMALIEKDRMRVKRYRERQKKKQKHRKTARKFARKRKRCLVCGRGYLGTKRQRMCSPKCKHKRHVQLCRKYDDKARKAKIEARGENLFTVVPETTSDDARFNKREYMREYMRDYKKGIRRLRVKKVKRSGSRNTAYMERTREKEMNLRDQFNKVEFELHILRKMMVAKCKNVVFSPQIQRSGEFPYRNER